MGTVISNLKARFGVDTTDFKKGLKEGDQALDAFKGEAGSKIDAFAEMFGINMGAVSDSVNTAFKSLNFLGQSLKGAAAGGNVLTISMKLLKYALVATGIGAIVVALGTLIAYFTKSGEGSDKFAKSLAQIKSVINNVIDRLAVFGKGVLEIMTGKFKQGWETMRGAFKGIGDEIKEDWVAAGALAEREDELEDKEIALINSLEERRAKAAELRRLVKEEIEDQKKKLDLTTQAEGIIKSIYADQLGVERERLSIMKEKLAIQSKDPTDEQRREVAEQEAKINGLLREQANELRALLREKNTAIKAVKEELDLEVKKLQTLQLIDEKAIVSNLKLPDFGIVNNVLAPLRQVQQSVKEITIDIGQVIEDSLEGLAESFGRMAGTLAAGGEGMRGWGTQMVGNAFGDMLINLGKVAIGTGITIEAIKAAFKKLGGIGAVAAGVALIALGSAIKTKISSTFSTSQQSIDSGQTSSGGIVYDTRKSEPINIHFTGELTADGPSLKVVLDKEINRVGTNT